MKKKLIHIAIFYIFFLIIISPVYGENNIKINIISDNEFISIKEPAIDTNNSLLVPIEPILKSMEVKVEYNNQLEILIIEKDDLKTLIQLNNNKAFIDSIEILLD